MSMKVPVRLHMNFKSRWLGSAAFFSGLGFFLLCVYYFGFTNLLDCNIGQILFHMLLPMAALASAVILLHVLRYDSAQLITALAGIYSLLMLIRSFSYGGAISIIVGTLWYTVCAAICLFMLTGFLTDKGYLVVAFFIPVVYRIVFVDIFKYILTLSLIDLVLEVAMLCGLVGFGMSALCMVTVPVRQRKGESKPPA